MNLNIALGVDPNTEHFPSFLKNQPDLDKSLSVFGKVLLDTSVDYTNIVKFQSAYFEEYGMDGYNSLQFLIRYARKLGYYIILDAKRGDIGTSAAAYARAYLTPGKDFEVDALTMHAYHGFESLNTCFEIAREYQKRIFVLARTSNSGAEEVQNHVAPFLLKNIEDYNASHLQEDDFGPIGAVIGATQPAFASMNRVQSRHTQWLCPGLGFQGAGADDASKFCLEGERGAIFPVSRGISGTAEQNSKITSKEEFKNAIRIRNSVLIQSFDV